jgi:hypothetical protein
MSFEPDRDVFWETPEGGKKVAAKGDATIKDHMSTGQFDRQGMLFPPQSLEEYRNTPERARAVELAAKNVDDPDGRYYPTGILFSPEEALKDRGPLRKLVRSTLRESRMPTELIQAMPKPPIGTEGDFTGRNKTASGYYVPSNQSRKSSIYLNPKDLNPGNVDKSRSVLRHELGHAIDQTVNPTAFKDYFGLSKAVAEGVAVGIDHRYGDGFLVHPTIYDSYDDEDWGEPSSRYVYQDTVDRVRDTGELRSSETQDRLNPNIGSHMGEQFYQPHLFDDPAFEPSFDESLLDD